MPDTAKYEKWEPSVLSPGLATAAVETADGCVTVEASHGRVVLRAWNQAPASLSRAEASELLTVLGEAMTLTARYDRGEREMIPGTDWAAWKAAVLRLDHAQPADAVRRVL
jgi:hypothetical protein